MTARRRRDRPTLKQRGYCFLIDIGKSYVCRTPCADQNFGGNCLKPVKTYKYGGDPKIALRLSSGVLRFTNIDMVAKAV